MITYQFPAMIHNGQVLQGVLNIALTVFVITCVGTLLLIAATRWVGVLAGLVPGRGLEVT